MVYLQRDYGTYRIGNFLYNLTHNKSDGSPKPVAAPRPIPGSDFGLEEFEALNQGYIKFFENPEKTPFFNEKTSAAVAAYLCNDDSYNVFLQGKKRFDDLQLTYGDFKPNAVGLDRAAICSIALE